MFVLSIQNFKLTLMTLKETVRKWKKRRRKTSPVSKTGIEKERLIEIYNTKVSDKIVNKLKKKVLKIVKGIVVQ